MNKKIIKLSLAASLLLSPAINTIVFPNIVMAEQSELSNVNFLNRFTINPVVPSQSIIGTETTIDFVINWTDPADINVLQAILKVNGNAEIISIGNKVNEAHFRDDGTVSYINDELQNDTHFPATIKITGPGPISVSTTIAYSDAIGEEEHSTLLELNVVEDSRSLDDAKKESIDEINDLNHLTKEEKEDYINRINESTNNSEVASILNESTKKEREISSEKLSEAKSNAQKTINELSNLTDEQKEDLLVALELATDLTGIEAVVKNAQEINGETSIDDESSDDKQDSQSTKVNNNSIVTSLLGVVGIVIVGILGWVIVRKRKKK